MDLLILSWVWSLVCTGPHMDPQVDLVIGVCDIDLLIIRFVGQFRVRQEPYHQVVCSLLCV